MTPSSVGKVHRAMLPGQRLAKLETSAGPGSFFGNRSFVLHFANKTRITCANFRMVESAPPYNNGTGVPSAVQATGAAPVATSHDHVPLVGAASTMGVSVFFLCLMCTTAYLVRGVGDL
ncbi:superoxide dismutase [Colletotrichum acutatum]